jgi:hypothetical protein
VIDPRLLLWTTPLVGLAFIAYLVFFLVFMAFSILGFSPPAPVIVVSFLIMGLFGTALLAFESVAAYRIYKAQITFPRSRNVMAVMIAVPLWLMLLFIILPWLVTLIVTLMWLVREAVRARYPWILLVALLSLMLSVTIRDLPFVQRMLIGLGAGLLLVSISPDLAKDCRQPPNCSA